KQTPYVEVVFEVAATDATAPGARFPWQGYFTDGTTERTIESLKLCGCTFPGGDIRNLTGVDRNVVSITVEETEYGPRVAWVNQLGSVSELNRLSGGELDAFAAKMKGVVLALSSRKSGGAPAKPSPAGPPPWDGQGTDPETDIPY